MTNKLQQIEKELREVYNYYNKIENNATMSELILINNIKLILAKIDEFI